MANVKMNIWDQIAGWLIVAGALNWGAIGWFGIDLVAKLGTVINMPSFIAIVYKVVGIAAAYFIFRVYQKFK